jgi:hypothetical protein
MFGTNSEAKICALQFPSCTADIRKQVRATCQSFRAQQVDFKLFATVLETTTLCNETKARHATALLCNTICSCSAMKLQQNGQRLLTLGCAACCDSTSPQSCDNCQLSPAVPFLVLYRLQQPPGTCSGHASAAVHHQHPSTSAGLLHRCIPIAADPSIAVNSAVWHMLQQFHHRQHKLCVHLVCKVFG